MQERNKHHINLSMPPLLIETLESPPRPAEPYLLADYIELRCLVNADRTISKADVWDIIQERRDLGEDTDEFNGNNSDLQDEMASLPALRKDKMALNVDDWFKHLQYRRGAFKEFYPFFLSENGNALSCYKRMTLKHKLYVFLLLSSNLGYINKWHRNALTSSFEMASSAALQSYLPKEAKVYVFGKNSSNTGRYSGKLWYKIQKLAQDLKESVICRENEFDPVDTGDNGLDVVGWVPLGDSARGFLTVFGQCACTLEWVSKQHSSSEPSWADVITLKAQLNNLIFIPYCFRDATGAWHRERDIKKSILIDRLRMVYLLRKKNTLLRDIPYSLVDQALAQTEPII